MTAALVLAGVAWWLLAPRAPSGSSQPAPATKTALSAPQVPRNPGPIGEAPAVAPPTRSSTPPSAPAPIESSATRTELTPPAARTAGPSYWVPPPNTRLRDRRSDAGPHAAREREAVGYALDTLDEDIDACLDQWRKTDVSLSGSLMLTIELDPKGVQKAFIDTDGGVPLGPQSCFANAVYGIDWSHLVDSPAKITRPYAFAADGGI